MGATCGNCKKDMMVADGCKVLPIELDGVIYKPVPYGEEQRYASLPIVAEQKKDPNHRCHDCGVKMGKLHHPGCDIEECPKCHGQLISCGCLEAEDKKNS